MQGFELSAGTFRRERLDLVPHLAESELLHQRWADGRPRLVRVGVRDRVRVRVRVRVVG